MRGPGTEAGNGVQGPGNWKSAATGPYLLTVVAGALYAATDEAHQYFVPMRQMDAADWLVDVAGVLLGALAALAIRRRRGKS